MFWWSCVFAVTLILNWKMCNPNVFSVVEYGRYTRQGRHGFERSLFSLLFLSFDHKLSRFGWFELEITRNALLSLIWNGLVVLDRANPLEIGRKFSLSILLFWFVFCLTLDSLNPLDEKYSKLEFGLDLSVDWSDVVDVTQHSDVVFCVADGDSNKDVVEVSSEGGGGACADVSTVVFRLCSIFK